ncbi:hypothetical protein Drorol1_Dr00015977 [Drosera rotundifolia]
MATSLITTVFAMILLTVLPSLRSCTSLGDGTVEHYSTSEPMKFVVGQSGEEKYTTINEAVAAASMVPEDRRVQIRIRKGVYDEIVIINRTNVELVGDGMGRTIITGNRRVTPTLRTINTATVYATKHAVGFTARRITFRNTAGVGEPAVALHSGADRSAFYRCRFEGYQDTLYAHAGRQFYRACIIVGTVDFIFGNATAVFQNTKIFLRSPQPGAVGSGFITAQSRHDPYDVSGFVLHYCQVWREPGSGPMNVYLGRPWRTYSRVVFMNTYLDESINPEGWSQWDNNTPIPDTVYYAEYRNSGPGSETIRRKMWPGYHLLSEDEAMQFTVRRFLLSGEEQEHWLSAAKVPFFDGLN